MRTAKSLPASPLERTAGWRRVPTGDEDDSPRRTNAYSLPASPFGRPFGRQGFQPLVLANEMRVNLELDDSEGSEGEEDKEEEKGEEKRPTSARVPTTHPSRLPADGRTDDNSAHEENQEDADGVGGRSEWSEWPERVLMLLGLAERGAATLDEVLTAVVRAYSLHAKREEQAGRPPPPPPHPTPTPTQPQPQSTHPPTHNPLPRLPFFAIARRVEKKKKDAV